jgi:hypothetical protein
VDSFGERRAIKAYVSCLIEKIWIDDKTVSTNFSL